MELRREGVMDFIKGDLLIALARRRHTFATRAIENGVQPKTLQKLLGHAALQMTMDFYCHVTEDTLFEEMQKMERMCV